VRTTLTLDDDVAHLLEREIRRRGTSLKQAVNYFLRLGIAADKKPSQKKFQVKPRELGLPPGLSSDNVAELIERLEGPEHR
jgi:hypothetical protein